MADNGRSGCNFQIYLRDLHHLTGSDYLHKIYLTIFVSFAGTAVKMTVLPNGLGQLTLSGAVEVT